MSLQGTKKDPGNITGSAAAIALVLPSLACEHPLSTQNHPNTAMGFCSLAAKEMSSFQRREICFLNTPFW